MPTREIPRGDWVAFLDDFSRRYQGALATIEVLAAGGAGGLLARTLPFVGVSADLKNHENDIAVMLAGTPEGKHVVHLIPQPTRVVLDEPTPGAGARLEIVSASEPVTRVSVTAPPATGGEGRRHGA